MSRLREAQLAEVISWAETECAAFDKFPHSEKDAKTSYLWMLCKAILDLRDKVITSANVSTDAAQLAFDQQSDDPAPGDWNAACRHIAQLLRETYMFIRSANVASGALTFDAFRRANVTRCVKWHPAGIESWSPSDWLTAITGELGELASLLKMRNRERDGLPGNKFSPTDKQVADELADVLTYLDLLAAALGVDLGAAAVEKFNEVSERVGFPDRIELEEVQR